MMSSFPFCKVTKLWYFWTTISLLLITSVPSSKKVAVWVCVDDMHDKHYVADLIVNRGLVTRVMTIRVNHILNLPLGFNFHC